MRQCLGNGQKINAQNDPWLRTIDNSYIQSVPIKGLEDLQVCELIDHNTNVGVKNILHDIFDDQDIVAIQALVIHFAQCKKN